MVLDYFPCYHSYAKKCEKLTDQELGRLFRALMKFSATGQRQELAGRESIAFDFIADDIARAKENYEAKCQKNAENIAKRYATTEYDRKQSNTDVYESYQNKSKDKDKDKSENKDKSKTDRDACACAFDRFWSAYPKKVGKEAARKAFTKAKASLDVMLAAIERQKNSQQWKRDNGQYIPNPATWLNQGRWDDEVQGQAPKVYRGEDFFDD